MRIGVLILLIHLAVGQVRKARSPVIDDISDHKDFKKLLRTKNNILILFSSNNKAAENVIKLFDSAAETVRGEATTVLIECSKNAETKKLCKKLKVAPNPYDLKHYNNGEFNKDYDRPMSVKSLVTFMRDPVGDKPWDEDEASKDVVHVPDSEALLKLIQTETRPMLIMFYTPWCGHCKRMKPDYNEAAKELKPTYVLAAIDMNKQENSKARVKFNVTSFPTLYYATNGEIKKEFDHERTKDGIIAFMKDPLMDHKKKLEDEDWESDPDSEVVHLSNDNFEASLRDEKSALVMFHTNWCGFCKKMKPEYEAAAVTMRNESMAGILAAVDVQKNPALAKLYGIKGFPTLQYFENAVFKFKVNVRTHAEIIEFMKDPKEPPPPKQPDAAWSENDGTEVTHLTDDTFKAFLRKRKHALVIFHISWCGHCKRVKPEFEVVAKHFKDEPSIGVAAVDCGKERTICNLYNVIAYPTIKYFSYFKTERDYKYGRMSNELIDYLTNPDAAPKRKAEPYGDFPGSESVLILHDDTFHEAISTHSNLLVMFYAPGCGHCTLFKPVFAEAAKIINKTQIGTLAAIDGSVYEEISRKYDLVGYPTMKHFRNGHFTGDYEGRRNVDSIFKFMADNDKKKKDEL